MTRRTAIQSDLFAAEEHRAKLERLGDPLQAEQIKIVVGSPTIALIRDVVHYS
ncbi:hypothetical protein [Tepidiphilus baoligensis]|uniref:Uncharacterized protein n=1 Tax=Tepidiphilus baoligensis TaxID=2698687 RepID=A0ABX1QQD9_9PROT|nr:hypothetical protein [Tepidiphilus baoligensis]NMH17355.1 hypothetical protein [Tepidiphilus baoligensis]